MIDKRAELVLSSEMEKHIIPAYDARWGPSYLPIHSRVFEKTASEVYVPERLIKAAASLSPREDGRYVHINAVGAQEAYGSNKNGDLFWEWSLLKDMPPGDVLEFLRKKGLPIPQEYGISTFETYAYPFVLHNNKDPIHSIGEKVVCAAYNERMKRGELIVFILKAKAPDLIDMIDKGEPIPWSMGCKVPFDICFVPGAAVEIPDGLVPIQEVVVGDIVRSHTGHLRRVTETFERDYTGDLLSIRVLGLPLGAPVTENHPYFAVKEEILRSCRGSANGRIRRCTPGENGNCKMCGSGFPEPEEVSAKDLDVGDYLAYPIPTHSSIDISDHEARIIGFYLGDGSPIRQRRGKKRDGDHVLQGLQFSLDSSQPAVLDALLEACAEFREANYYDYDKGDWSVRFYDRDVAQHAIDTCAECSGDKRVRDIVVGWPESAKMSLVGGYLDTDGSVDERKGSSRFSSTSPLAIWGLNRVLLSLGMVGAIHQETTQSGYTPGTHVWILHLNAADTWKLAEFSAKVRENGHPARTKKENFIAGNYVYRRITEIDSVFVERRRVHNLAVEEDESYIVDGVAVHNCSICKNVARNRDQYCEHLRTLLNVTLPDGRKVAAENWFPRFFDISRVLTPAFPSAYSLRKVAGVALPVADPAVVQRQQEYSIHEVNFTKVASAQADMRRKRTIFKLGEISKAVPAEPGQDNLGKTLFKPKVQKILSKLVKKDDDATGCLPSMAVKSMRSTSSPEELINGATASGILLKKPEVEMITDGDARNVPDRLDLESVLPRLLSKFKDMVPSRSLFDPPFANRVVRIIKISGPEPGAHLDKGASEVYTKYLDVLGQLEVDDLVKAAERILLTRDPHALENAVAGVKTASDRFRPVTPFLVGLKLKKDSHV